jgi:hypothetical protein
MITESREKPGASSSYDRFLLLREVCNPICIDRATSCSPAPTALEHSLRAMGLECINPKDLPAPSTYGHVVVATGDRLVFVAGQEPESRSSS